MGFCEKALHVACVIFVCSSVRAGESKINSFTKQWIIGADSTFMDSRYIAKIPDSFVYANCSRSNKCDIALENRDGTKVCNFRLIANSKRALLRDPSHLAPRLFGGRKVIISHLEITTLDMYLVVTLTDMTTCHTTYLTFEYERSPYLLLTGLLVYENTFDVIFGGRVACAGLERCRISYDGEGRRLGDPSAFETNLVLFQAEVNSRGFWLFGLTDRPFELRAVHVSSSGRREKILAKADDLYDPYFAPRAFSSANDLFGFCWYNASYPFDPLADVQCKQFNSRTKLVISAKIAELGMVRDMAVLNLDEGGIILVTSSIESKYKVTMVHRDGRISSLFEIQVDSPFSLKLLDEITNHAEVFCLHFISHYYNTKLGLLSYHRECIPKNYEPNE